MGDPLNPWEDEDRLPPAGDLNEDSPALTGTINTMGGGIMTGGSMSSSAMVPALANRTLFRKIVLRSL